ncbi:MAG: hypothetical protein J6R01_05485 [Alistipes sp.]|nr:hypothetical protein [Alistipes sp.]
MRHLQIFTLLILTIFCATACDKPMQESEHMTEATYMFETAHIYGSTYVCKRYELRNDHLTFYNDLTGAQLHIDLYSPLDNNYLPAGNYTFGETGPMAANSEECYFMADAGSQPLRFKTGVIRVEVTQAEDRQPVHHIDGYFELFDGYDISLCFNDILVSE